ncbi:amidohydrolase family protein [Mucilaginibacter sp. HMF5004]|uniref:amidohydrolase family protein n=1 Tax=Mucilaginibacter rivuli TaxID=2857527 RepID=UPI001C5F8BF5|nr:amidohydrolase family protein [Mucilaginibacter rivuli]MBW4890181.1 amidohydrolase family protein [Mucilaginibacter rivuli]
MPKIDAHQHFWIFDPVRDSWINDDMSVIQRDFLPGDLEPVLEANGINGCVAVQADQSEIQNDFLLGLANDNAFIKGVVGWVDLRADNIEERLEYYSGFEKMKGLRHVLQGEEDRALMLKPAFMNGISKLAKYGFTYDILIFPDQLQYVSEFVSAFPDTKFVIDHIAKPYIKDKKIDDWATDIRKVAQHQNLYCKVSGMVTEADWKNHKPADFIPYLDVVFEAFGAERLMFGSDWPVCQVAANYTAMKSIVEQYTVNLSTTEQDKFWGDNAVKFYNL